MVFKIKTSSKNKSNPKAFKQKKLTLSDRNFLSGNIKREDMIRVVQELQKQPHEVIVKLFSVQGAIKFEK